MKIGICTIIKNEQRYLKEWIEYNQALGIDEIHLYEDVGSESHEQIVSQFQNVYLHDIRIDHRILSDKSCNKHAYLVDWYSNNNPHNLDYCFFIDVDEYVKFKEGYTLNDFVEEFKDEYAVFLSWKMYGASGQIHYTPGKLVDKFYEAQEVYTDSLDERTAYLWVKSFVNMRKAPHYWDLMHICEGGVNTDHEVDVIKNNLYDKAWINHYFTKSWEEWCMRFINRDDKQWSNRDIDMFFIVNHDLWHKHDELIRFFRELQQIYKK